MPPVAQIEAYNLLALLPEAPREREETPEPTKPEEREMLEPKAALLPEAPREREKAQGSVQWLAADIERMKRAKRFRGTSQSRSFRVNSRVEWTRPPAATNPSASAR